MTARGGGCGRRRRTLRDGFVLLAASLALAAADGRAGPAGRWDGTVAVGPAARLAVAVTLDVDDGGAWSGRVRFPARRDEPYELGGIRVVESIVVFDVPALPGRPSFRGRTAPDGRTLSGLVLLAGRVMPFELRKSNVALADR